MLEIRSRAVHPGVGFHGTFNFHPGLSFHGPVAQWRTFVALAHFLFEVMDYLKEQGVFVKFRGQGKRNPKASGVLSDFYIIENIHAATVTK